MAVGAAMAHAGHVAAGLWHRSAMVGHLKMAIRPDETDRQSDFELLDLINRGDLVKIVLLKVVELCKISNFALGSMR
jgi:hypothetical protein